MLNKSLLFLTPRYWPARDGTAIHMQALAERFCRDGYEIEVLTADPLEIDAFRLRGKKKTRPFEEIHHGVKIKRFRAKHLPFHTALMNFLYLLPGKKSKIFYGLPHAHVPDLFKFLKNNSRPYSLIFTGVLPYRIFFYAAALVKKKAPVPVIGLPLVHLGEPGRPEIRKKYLDEISLSLLKDCELLLLNTEAEIEPLVKAGLERKKLMVAGAGIDPENLAGGRAEKFREKFSLKGPIVFLISTQTHDKGSHHLVEAAKIVWQKHPEIHLVLAGEVRPDFEDYLSRQEAAVLGKILKLGAISDEEKKDLLAAGDIMCMPSRADSFGIAYLEAWFYQKPVVGCFAGGVPEVIDDGENGFLVPFGEVHILAEYIEKLLGDRALAEKLGRAGQKKVLGNYTWEKIYQKIKEAAKDLLN